MKNLVLTIAVGKDYEIMSNFTHQSIKDYTDKIGADFFTIAETNCTSPHWEKFVRIYDFLNEYDRILYLDTDIIIREDAPDIFEIAPEDSLGLFNEMPYTPQRNESLYQACRDHGIVLKKWNGKYYNTGVMVIPKNFKNLFEKPEKESCNFYEQGYFNAALAKYLETHEDKIFDLPYKFNRMTCMDSFTGEPRFASYFIHYAGYPSLEFVLNLIEQDLIRWKEDAPEFKYKRNILISVTGGLGDQVDAEPTIRFLKEKIYPEDNVAVKSHWPELFSHINVELYNHIEFRAQMDTPYYSVTTLPEPTTLMWSCVSNLLCHTVDFISMAVLKRILPNKEKTIQLPPVKKQEITDFQDKFEIQDLKNLVLIHPGKHWSSKTFPTDWWQLTVDNMKGLPLCIIGKNDDTRGTVDITADDTFIDLRDRLTLRELIILISQAKILVSNDSAPVHLAGAFNNHIVLIPTCKHPDHILPFRRGNQNYKTTVLYKKLMCYEYESAPTHMGRSLADYVPGKWEKYLPIPEDVVAVVNKIRNKNG